MLEVAVRAAALGDISAQSENIVDSCSLKSAQQADYIVSLQADAWQMRHALDPVFVLDSGGNLRRRLTVFTSARPVCNADKIRIQFS